MLKRYATKCLALLLTLALSAGLLASTALAAEGWEEALADAASVVRRTPAQPGSVGGEWGVLGLSRSGLEVPQNWYDDYYAALERYVAACGGMLSTRKYTEYARTVLAVTALGKDPRDVAGYDLLAPLGDFDKCVWQGLNGAAFALIALDCSGYEVPEAPEGAVQASREKYVDYLLERQLTDGGWAFSGTVADPDMTAMVLQALAPYREDGRVAAAVERGVERLTRDVSWTAQTAEGAAQAVIALCTLGIRPGDELVEGLLAYRLADGSFSHLLDGSGNQMATEQALCALTALSRLAEGKPALYEMSGVRQTVSPRPVIWPAATFSDIQGHPDQAAIEALARRGIVSGKGEGLFDPEASMTRAEFAVIVVAALGLAKEDGSGRFSDVAADSWYAPFVGAAVSAGIVAGTGQGEFSPEEEIPRQQAAVMLAQAARLCGLDTTVSGSERWELIPEGGCSDWAANGMAFCLREGILEREERAEEAVLRCDMARMVFRLLERGDLLS